MGYTWDVIIAIHTQDTRGSKSSRLYLSIKRWLMAHQLNFKVSRDYQSPVILIRTTKRWGDWMIDTLPKALQHVGVVGDSVQFLIRGEDDLGPWRYMLAVKFPNGWEARLPIDPIKAIEAVLNFPISYEERIKKITTIIHRELGGT